MSVDGRARVVARGVYDYGWTPDGRRVAYAAAAGIFRVDVAGGGRTRISAPACARSPRYSPSGRQLAYVACASGDTTPLVVADGDGAHPRVLVPDTHGYDDLEWSPDGSELAAAVPGASDGTTVIAAIDVATGSVHPLSPAGFGLSARWSPDGSRVAVSGLFDTCGLVIAARDGSSSRRIPVRPCQPVTWSPDGSSVAFATRGEIMIVPADGSRTARAVTHARRYGYENSNPVWSPSALPRRLSGTPVADAVPTDSRQTGRMLETHAVVDYLAADGPRVATAYDGVPDCVELWDPRAHTLVRFAENACYSEEVGAEFQEIDGLALAGTRAVWTVDMQTLHFNQWVESASVARRAPTPLYNAKEDTEEIPSLSGRGRTVAFTSAIGHTAHAMRVRGMNAIRVGSGFVLDARDGYVAVLTSAPRVSLLRDDGRLVSTCASRGRVHAAAIEGRRVLVSTSKAVLLCPGGVSWPLAAGEHLADASGGIAALVRGSHIRLLRIADGASIVIEAPTPSHVLAQLTPDGLYYSYAVDEPRRGRVVFVPMPELARRFSST